jgi:hypothetical protein
MSIYRFGFGLDDFGPDFLSGAPDFRSDTDQRNSALSVYDTEAPEIKTARTLADEIINISGAEIKVFVRTDNSDFDVVWDEDADPTYWSSDLMKAFFKPAPLETELKKWGADTINKTEVVFSHRQLYEKYGERMLRTGDVLQLPFNSSFIDRNPSNYRVINGTPSGNFRYTWLYFSCSVETLNADISVRPQELFPMPEEVPINTNGAYRESI